MKAKDCRKVDREPQQQRLRKMAGAKAMPHDRSNSNSSHRLPIFSVSALVFAVLASSGIALNQILCDSLDHRVSHEALDLAVERGNWFAKELDIAFIPVYSLAQFALELESFADLPEQIGRANATIAQTNDLGTAGGSSFNSQYRNVSGVCDNPDRVAHFDRIAATIMESANVDGVIQSLSLAPSGVVCLAYSLNATNDDGGAQHSPVLDNTSVLGLNLFEFNDTKVTARETIIGNDLRIDGPQRLTQCPTCGSYYISLLPIASDTYKVQVGDQSYSKWGFATLLISWSDILERSELPDMLGQHGFEFRLVQKELVSKKTTSATGSFGHQEVELARSDQFGTKVRQVSTSFQTLNKEWTITVQFDDPKQYKGYVLAFVIVFSLGMAFLIGCVLAQKQRHAAVLSVTLAQAAKVDMERSMTAYFAHELRNPLSAIDSALQSLPQDDLPPATKETLSGIQVCLSFMSSIMDTLLDVRKMEEGQLLLQSSPFSLQRLADDARRIALPTLRSGVDLVVRTETTCTGTSDTGTGSIGTTEPRGDWVLGDESRIQQILTNLVAHAVRNTTLGSITIVVGWEGCNVRLECCDTGPGLLPEVQSTLFDSFTQRTVAEDDSACASGGCAPVSGLDLSMTNKMVALMGGTIQVSSNPKEQPGTTIKVLLPLQVCDPSEPDLLPENVKPLDESLSILLVDDIRVNREMLKRRLVNRIAPNCCITEAINGEEALDICKEQSFDVVIMDYYMEESGGVMVGTDVIAAMRRSKMTSLVIGCSGNDLGTKFREAGADLVWTKPLPSNAEIILQLRRRAAARPSFTSSQSYRIAS